MNFDIPVTRAGWGPAGFRHKGAPTNVYDVVTACLTGASEVIQPFNRRSALASVLPSYVFNLLGARRFVSRLTT